MMKNEENPTEAIEAVETIDVVADDLIQGLASALRSIPDKTQRAFVLTGEGKHVMAELADREDIPVGAITLGPIEFVSPLGEPADRVRTYFRVEENGEAVSVTLDAEVNLV